MKIVIITPARPSSRSGNRTTALRWARILRQLGHRVHLTAEYDAQPADLAIALHAWRSAAAIQRFRLRHPGRPLIVGLSGTDIYEYIDRDPETTMASLEYADRLVALQDLARRRLPARLHGKLRVIHQSASPLPRRGPASVRHFEVAVIGHLRAVKDPLRAAEAARRLPATSRVRIVHLGGAATPQWAAKAKAEMQTNPRYVWRGEVPRAEVRRTLGRVKAVVLSSLSEGGANIISEALMARVPVLASRIDGSVGLLGRDYPGYFRIGDTAGLAQLLNRIETDRGFLAGLKRAVTRRSFLFRPEREKRGWHKLLQEVRPRS
jgi:putative glycosyltransferase (TIGR04348 family)